MAHSAYVEISSYYHYALCFSDRSARVITQIPSRIAVEGERLTCIAIRWKRIRSGFSARSMTPCIAKRRPCRIGYRWWARGQLSANPTTLCDGRDVGLVAAIGQMLPITRSLDSDK